MGFEPLPSAVQSRIHNVVVVHRCSKMPVKQPIRLYKASQMFAVVRVGWRQIGVSSEAHPIGKGKSLADRDELTIDLDESVIRQPKFIADSSLITMMATGM